jgi:16S rRNA (cytosine1402-N4)-methyltransferase
MKNQSPSLDLTHFPVMLNEVIKISSPSQGGKFIDCTFGGGGYSKQLLKFPKTLVRGLDRDKTVNIIAKKLENKFPNRFIFHQIKFSELDTVSSDLVDTVIFDLGLSSIQLNDFERGFSFKSSKNLDMSMGLSQISAQDAINNLSEINLKLILKILGEEKEASKKLQK